jgi:hypothetical protein
MSASCTFRKSHCDRSTRATESRERAFHDTLFMAARLDTPTATQHVRLSGKTRSAVDGPIRSRMTHGRRSSAYFGKSLEQPTMTALRKAREIMGALMHLLHERCLWKPGLAIFASGVGARRMKAHIPQRGCTARTTKATLPPLRSCGRTLGNGKIPIGNLIAIGSNAGTTYVATRTSEQNVTIVKRPYRDTLIAF